MGNYVEVDGMIVPKEGKSFPTHSAQYSKGGYKTFKTIQEMKACPIEFLEEGCRCYCVSEKKDYRWIEGSWVEIEDNKVIKIYETKVPVEVEKIVEIVKEPQVVEKIVEKEPQIIEKVVEQKISHIHEIKEFKNLKIDDNSVSLTRTDGTVALEMRVDENGDGNIVFYNKSGEPIGVFNPSVFEGE